MPYQLIPKDKTRSTILLSQGENSIGRRNLPQKDNRVSRRQIRITVDAGSILLTQEGTHPIVFYSTEGKKVELKRRDVMEIHEGDSFGLLFGEYTYTLQKKLGKMSDADIFKSLEEDPDMKILEEAERASKKAKETLSQIKSSKKQPSQPVSVKKSEKKSSESPKTSDHQQPKDEEGDEALARKLDALINSQDDVADSDETLARHLQEEEEREEKKRQEKKREEERKEKKEKSKKRRSLGRDVKKRQKYEDPEAEMFSSGSDWDGEPEDDIEDPDVDDDDVMEIDGPKEKPLCHYGSKCYRENPNHRAQFRHE
ncbi:protein 4.1-like [Planoprotostelium fungivorum]|uniref:Protein 4.1-like n=1 Tax=Planoprotostelium fungivorum TaxID=1890364 RepID=A0A2P6N0L4_9EUKA|nr:protein 4.1-like [Planoprotostelium fungivorum]